MGVNSGEDYIGRFALGFHTESVRDELIGIVFNKFLRREKCIAPAGQRREISAFSE